MCIVYTLGKIDLTFSIVTTCVDSITFTVGGSSNLNVFKSVTSWSNSGVVAITTLSRPITSPVLIFSFTF